MLLAVDIGNTNITFGIFDGDELIKKINAPSKAQCMKDFRTFIIRHLEGIRLSGCIVASVVTGLDEKFKTFIDREFNLNTVILSAKTRSDLNIKIDCPFELGADRIANALGALEKFPNENLVVIDYGTAITFDVITKNRDFIGGLIAPGFKMQLNSLFNGTSKLPEIELDCPKNAVATNTKDAILSGVVLGNAYMTSGMIRRYKEELAPDEYKIIATGGFAKFIESYMKESFDGIEPDLTLIGLMAAYNKLKHKKQ